MKDRAPGSLGTALVLAVSLMTIAATLVLSVVTLSTWPAIYQDEAYYANVAWNFAREGIVRSSFYPGISHYNPFHIGVLCPALVAVSQAIFGQDLWGARLPGAILGIVAAVVVSALGVRAFKNRWAALLAAALTLSSFGYFTSSHILRPEPWSVCALLGSIYVLSRCEDWRGWGVVLAGFLSASTIEISLPHVAMVSAATFAVVAARFRSVRALALFLAPLCVIGLVWLSLRMVWFHGPGFLADLVAAKSALGAGGMPITTRIGTSLSIFWPSGSGVAPLPDALMTLLAFPCCAYALWRWARHGDRAGLYFGLPFAAATLALLVQGRLSSHYLIILRPLVWGIWTLVFVRIWTGSTTRWRRILCFSSMAALLLLNTTILCRKAWLSRHSMATSTAVREAIRGVIPQGQRVLCIESLYFIAPELNMVGVRELDVALRHMEFSDYVNDRKIAWIIDTEYFDLVTPSARESLSERIEANFVPCLVVNFPSDWGNTYLKPATGTTAFDSRPLGCQLRILKRCSEKFSER